MFLNLLILKLKHLKSIGVSSLGCFSLCKVVYNSLVRVCLFNIFICKVNYQVSIWIGLPPDTVCEHDLFLAWLVDTLNFTIMAHYLVYNFLVLTCFLVIFFQILETVILLKFIRNLLIVDLGVEGISWVFVVFEFLLWFLVGLFMCLLPVKKLGWWIWYRLDLSTKRIPVVLQPLWILGCDLSLYGRFLIYRWLLLRALLSLFTQLHLHFV